MSDSIMATMVEAFESRAAEELETAVDPDGWIYRLSDGEVIGHAATAETFTIDDEGKAEWALELRSRIEGAIAGDTARLEALTEMLRSRIRDQERRLAWWEWRFAGQLTEFARSLLTGKKARTAKFAWGQVAFRNTAGTNRIKDMAAAVAWVRFWKPERVKVVETVNVTDVLKTRDEVAGFEGDTDDLDWLESSGPTERVTITTGIATKGAKNATQ